MGRRARRCILVAVAIVSLLLIAYLSIGYTKPLRIESYVVEGISTPSIRALLSGKLYESYLFLGKRKLETSLMDLAYVDDAKIGFKDNTLVAEINCNEDGVVIYSGESAYFFDKGRLDSIDLKDVPALDRQYIAAKVDSVYLQYMERFGFGLDFISFLDALNRVGEKRTLITKAEFGNISSREMCILTLILEPIDSKLTIYGYDRLDYLDKCLDLITSFCSDNIGQGIFGLWEFELRSTGLIRIKR